MNFPHGETVTVIRHTAGKDRNGDPLPGSDSAHTIEKCGIAWASAAGSVGTSENTDRREAVLSTVTLYAPVGADILSTDHVVLPDGDKYRVVGKPTRWRSPFTGREFGVEVLLKAVL
ncbi:hypothetical protein [Rhodococcus opacus]|uniref:Head-tail adaptor protein n=1 Tax=Rhodococcus opacus TaxID=37919 RepID=A0A2S8JAT8_RHOOP|nr:hypothetical protein [Rhodococcus opacus]PQP24161.1 hypothetical protein C5613_14875 [Rhodococcus opacus]